jgi:hypothetical protein
MNESESIAWAAGLFEGEGSVCVLRQNHGSRPHVQINLESSDEDVVERFATVVGFGNLTIRPAKPNRKQMFAWRGHGWENVKQLHEKFLPYLGKRRNEQFVKAFSQQPLEPATRRILYRDAKGRVSPGKHPIVPRPWRVTLNDVVYMRP